LLVLVVAQAGAGAEVDHGVTVGMRRAQEVSRITLTSESPDELQRRAV
jgi:hypothetical protein